MALDASTLTVKVQSDGIETTTKSLEALAVAGEKAEKGTSNIGKKSGDAAQQAAAGYTALTNQLQRLASQFDGINNALSSQTRAWGALGNVQAQAANTSAQVGQTTAANASAAEAFVEKLRRQADTIGMTTKELRDYNLELARKQAAELGVTARTDEYINKLKSAKGAHEGLSLATAGTSRELLVLTHEMATGQMNRFYGSLLVLAERVNVMPAIWKALGTAAEGVGVSFGVMLGSIVAVGVALGVAVMTYMHSAKALKELNREVVLTGGAAGATGDALYTMANRIGSSFGEFGKAREAVMALAATGKFAADQINIIAEAAVGLEKYAGVSIEKTAAAFEKLAGNPLKITDKGFKDVSNAAMQLDEKMHFLEPTVLAHIIQLERQGEHASASRVAIAALAEEEKKRAEELKAQLTPLGAMLDTIAAKASNFWNALLHKGSLTDQIQGVQEQLQHAIDNGVGPTRVKELQNQLASLKNQVIQNEYDAAEKGHQKTMDRLANEQQVYLRNLMERAKGEENLHQRLARFDNVIAQQREKAKSDPAFAARMQEVLSDASVEMMRKQVERDSIKAAPKPHTEGMSGLDATINRLNDEYEVQKRAMDNQIKLIDFKNKYGLMADEEAQSEKEKLLDDELNLEKDHLKKALDAIKAFHTDDIRLKNDAASKKYNIEKQLDKVLSDIGVKGEMNDLVPDVNFAAAQEKQQKEQDNIIKQVEKQTKSVQAQVDAYNKLPEAVKAAGVRQKEMASEVEQAKIDSLQAEKDSLQSNDLIEQAMNKRRIDQIDKEIEARKKLKAVDAAKEANDKQNNAALNRSSALTKIATEQVKMWKDTGNEIEKALTSAFGNAGSAAGKMFKAFAEGQASQIELADKVQQVKAKDGLSDAERTKQLTALQDQAAQTQIGAYANMADAAAGFFDKQSQGYKIATTVSKAFHLAETAMALASIPAKLAAGAATMFAQSGWGGFAGVAAMTAAVAAFGVAITGGGGGPMSAADQQKIQGTGTVLGSQTITDGTKVILVGEKSNSIANSLKVVEKTSGLGLAVQNDMLSAMTSLNNNITALAKSIATSGSLTGVTASSSLTGIASVVANTLGKLPLGLGGIASKIATAIFGGKVTVDDTGLQVNKQTLAQIAAQGVSASQYTNTTKSGGWFSSDKHNTDLSKLDPNTTDQFTKVVLSMENAIKQAGVSLGVSGDAFNQKLNSFVVDIGKVSLKGMTSDQIQTALQNIFSKLGDQMSMFMFSDLAKYQKLGEGLLETVSRVANDLMQVNDVFKVLGKTMPQAAAGIAQAEKLVDSFGSSDALTKAVKSYQDAIYTDNEKLAPVVKSVQDSLASMGLSSVKTKEDFKLVVDSLDLTSDSGVALFNKLMTLAPTFGSAIDGLAKVNDTTKSSIQSVIDKLKQFSDNIHKFRDGLVLSASSPLTPQQQLAAAASQFETTIKKAMAGDENAQGHVTDIAQSYLDAARTMFASSDSYTAIFQKVEDELAKVQDFADGGVSDAQKQLDTMTNQLTSLNTLNGTATDILNSLNNLVNGTSPASTATNSNATNAELLQTLKTLVGTVQQSDANNVNALQNNAAATYDSQASVGKAIGEVIKAVVTTTKTGELYQTVER